MYSLKDPNVSYIVLSGKIDASITYLYSREYYKIMEMNMYQKGSYERSIIAYAFTDNNTLREDAIKLMDHFEQNDIIVKYSGEENPKRINNDYSEHPMGVLMYNTDSEKKSYIYEGISFSFIEQPLYVFPKKKEDFRNGMTIECFSNNKWIERKIHNIEVEYSNMYNLLVKYGKVRVRI